MPLVLHAPLDIPPIKMHEGARSTFSILFGVDLVWVTYLFVRHLTAGEFIGGLGDLLPVI